MPEIAYYRVYHGTGKWYYCECGAVANLTLGQCSAGHTVAKRVKRKLYRVLYGYCGEYSKDFPYTVDGLRDAWKCQQEVKASNLTGWDGDAMVVNPDEADSDNPSGLSDAEKQYIEYLEGY